MAAHFFLHRTGSRRSSRRIGVWLIALTTAFCWACDRGVGGEGPEAAAASGHSVLLITIDTLRADFVHAYGFGRENTPALDALAARGVLFERAIAAASLTAPAHASIMTSRYAREHSIGTLNGETRLEGLPTLAEHFRDHGYATAAFVSNVVLRRRIGLDAGFDVYDQEMQAGELNRRAYVERKAEGTVGAAIRWLDGLAAADATPYFLWVHVQDPHGPYVPPEPFRGRLGDVPIPYTKPLPVLEHFAGRAGIPSYQALEGEGDPAVYVGRYAEEIMYADHWLGQLIDRAEEVAGQAGAVILLTSDHGESLGEAGYFFQHGHATTEDLARVPLIVTAPGISPARSRALVSHVDIAPTLTELALGRAMEGSGLSLVGHLHHGDPLPPRPVFSDTEGEAGLYDEAGFARAGGALAFVKPSDPAMPLRFEARERSDRGVWRSGEIDDERRQTLLRYLRSRAAVAPVGVMEQEHIDQLRALGYLGEGADGNPEGEP